MKIKWPAKEKTHDFFQSLPQTIALVNFFS